MGKGGISLRLKDGLAADGKATAEPVVPQSHVSLGWCLSQAHAHTQNFYLGLNDSFGDISRTQVPCL